MESVRKRLEAAEKIHSQKQNIIQELQTQVKMIPTDTDPRNFQKNPWLTLFIADRFVETKENF